MMKMTVDDVVVAAAAAAAAAADAVVVHKGMMIEPLAPPLRLREHFEDSRPAAAAAAVAYRVEIAAAAVHSTVVAVHVVNVAAAGVLLVLPFEAVPIGDAVSLVEAAPATLSRAMLQPKVVHLVVPLPQHVKLHKMLQNQANLRHVDRQEPKQRPE
jgi:hypothetical protein